MDDPEKINKMMKILLIVCVISLILRLCLEVKHDLYVANFTEKYGVRPCEKEEQPVCLLDWWKSRMECDETGTLCFRIENCNKWSCITDIKPITKGGEKK